LVVQAASELGNHFQSSKKFILNFLRKFFKFELVMERDQPGHGRIMSHDTYGFKTIFHSDNASRPAPTAIG
jgi:hypothetical protein